ncbi:alpha/beta hydrolase [Streptomyces roseolus]|uniref:alpha/beta hydrolase n=1 Tax=Streptomyces roseolus TaxID=67358 RepID=UPI001E3438F3|nr:alpha/beta hydrolase [Streptomyces roseolus]
MEHVAGPPPVLEPLAQAFVEAHACPGVPGGAGPVPTGKVLAALHGEADRTPDVEEEWLALPGCDGERIRVRILRPADSEEPLPVVLYLHGLGWTHTSATTHQRLLEDLVLGSDAAVVVPEYDRPPAARYPVAVEQSYTVARWIAEHGADWRLDGCRIAVAGVSAGANLAAALTLVAKERGGVDFVHQVLVCPVTDATGQTASYRHFAEGYFLGSAVMRCFWQSYAPDAARRGEITASPLLATTDDLRGLPPALVLTAEADVVRDEGEAYAAKLRAAGVSVVSARYHGTIHGFILFDMLRESDAGRAARTQTVDTLHVALHRGW